MNKYVLTYGNLVFCDLSSIGHECPQWTTDSRYDDKRVTFETEQEARGFARCLRQFRVCGGLWEDVAVAEVIPPVHEKIVFIRKVTY